MKMKQKIDDEKNQKKLSQTSHHEEWQFTLKPSELFEPSEHNATFSRESNFGSRIVQSPIIDDAEINDSDYEKHRELKKIIQLDQVDSDD